VECKENYFIKTNIMKKSSKELPECLTFNSNKPIDFMRMEEYDPSKMGIVAFSNGSFNFNGYSIGFSNMRSYPILFMGEEFNSVETAYIACNYGLNNDDCIRIQREIQASTNGLKCKRQYRRSAVDKQYGRKDFFKTEWHFNLMLYLVWEKCKRYEDFREMLLAIPDDWAIIESQNPFAKVKVGNWGCKNLEAHKAYKSKVKELKEGGMKGELKIKEKATIDTWNIGIWTGCNHQGKILMACRTALRTGTEPCIQYELINDAEVYLFGRLLHFEEIK